MKTIKTINTTNKLMNIEVTEVEVQRLYTTQPVYHMHYIQNGVTQRIVLPIHLDQTFTDKLVESGLERSEGKSFTFTTEYMFEKFSIDFKENTTKLTMVNRFGVKSSLELDNDEFNKVVHMLNWLETFDKKETSRIGIVSVEPESIELIPFKVKTFAEDCSIVLEQVASNNPIELAV
ncbi:hypothetical protein bcgnr5378_07130 [Bacillus cereus]|uniref:Uncharacterized protein n=1 Tax=Bacillus cereus TaxID=1396 RepID=A0A164NXK6_BACCE|nr:hypothetical protein [Bacillus cereus]KZD65969.1 hypothetical protein B4088_2726 [Bacillus cereus]